MQSYQLVDLINGSFETLGAFATWSNVAKLHKHKRIYGVDWRSMAFFTLWGLWNLVYYPVLGQWWSFAGGVLLVSGNVVWVLLAMRYREGYVEWP